MRTFMKNTGWVWGLLLLAILAVNLLAPAPAAAESWKFKWGHIAGVAGEALSTGDAVCIGSDGKTWKADADNSTARPAIGVIGKGGAAGSAVEIVTSGVLTGIGTGNRTLDDARNGTRLYLQTTAGVFNSTSPTVGNQTMGVTLPGGNDALIAPVLPVQGAGY